MRHDPKALRTIYERCSARALAVALKILRARPDAEEIIQETFLEVWKRAREYDPQRGGIEGWVLTIARSRAIDRLRTAGAGARLKTAQQAESPPDLVVAPPDAAEQQQERERVAAALATLPPEQRSAVEMAYFEGLSQREIAERTGDPLGTVKTRMRLGMEKLSAILRESDARSGR